MNKLSYLLFTALIFISLSSCDSRKADNVRADKRIEQIRLLINRNEFNTAKHEIDSIHLLFPMLVEKRRIAVALKDTIDRRESSRSLAYCDSLLPLKIHILDSIQKNFRFEKDKKYQTVGDFVYKTQQTESNASRTYLKAYVDENADFFLVSNYCGAKIEQQSVEVSANDLFAHTDTISLSDPINHRFDDGGSHFESIIFKNQSQKGVVDFIAQSTSKQLKVTLRGTKTYAYFLSDADRKAICETYRLWKVRKDVVQLQKEINKATQKIERINKSKKQI